MQNGAKPFDKPQDGKASDAVESFMRRFSSRFNTIWQNNSCPEKLGVAVSGGSDSMALALLLQSWCKRHDVKLFAYTVNHNLREEAQAEAQQTKDWLAQSGVDCAILQWEHKTDPRESAGNLHQQARIARYNMMAKACAQNGVEHLCLAHHKDDQAETIMMRLAKGSGVRGLCGMQEATDWGGLCLVRPLLWISRKELRSFLESKGQPFVEDPSNTDDRYTRSRWRKLLPQLAAEGLTADSLCRMAERLQTTQDMRSQNARTFVENYVKQHEAGFAVVDIKALCVEHSDTALQVLRALLIWVGGNIHGPKHKKMQNLFAQMQRPGFKGATLAGCRIVPAPKSLGTATDVLLCAEHERQSTDVQIRCMQNASLEVFNRYSLVFKTCKQACDVRVEPLAAWRANNPVHPYVNDISGHCWPWVVKAGLPVLEQAGKVCIPHLGIGCAKGNSFGLLRVQNLKKLFLLL